MDSLFAPWRMQWVTRDRPDMDEQSDCIFCTLPEQDDDRRNNIVARSERVYLLLNNMPYNPGHLMTIPYEHTGALHGLDDRSLLDCMKTTQLATRALDDSLSTDGFNIGLNIGAAGGASITDHFHMHVIPRWKSDTSFMPLTANTSIVEEAIDETYDRLYDALLRSERTKSTTGDGAIEIIHT